MMQYISRPPIGVLLSVSLSVFCLTDTGFAGFERLTIRNTTGSFANALQVSFDSPVEQVRFLTLAEGGRDATGELGDGGLTASFAPRTIGLIPPTESGRAFLDFEVAHGAHAALSRNRPSIWGSGSEDLGDVTAIGAPPVLTFEQDGSGAFLASATFFNPEEFPVIYSEIGLYKDNRIETFNIDKFYIPTGTQVLGLPPSITLDPGKSLTLSFGEVDPRLSQLAMARVAAASSPDDFLRVASAEIAVIPEPHTAALLGNGLLVLIAVGWRHLRASRHTSDALRPGTSLPPCAG